MSNNNIDLIKANKRIAKLEELYAGEIQKVANLLKENARLETKLETSRKQKDLWRKLYRRANPDRKIKCNRQNAMVLHGEIDISEVLGREPHKD